MLSLPSFIVFSLLSTHTDVDVRNVFNQFFSSVCMRDLVKNACLIFRAEMCVRASALEWKRKTNNPLGFGKRLFGEDVHWPNNYAPPSRFRFAHSRVIRATQPLARPCMRCRANNAGNCFVLHHASSSTHENTWKPPESIKWNAHFVRRMHFIFRPAVCCFVVLCCALFAREIVRAICDRFAVEYFRLVFFLFGIRVLADHTRLGIETGIACFPNNIYRQRRLMKSCVCFLCEWIRFHKYTNNLRYCDMAVNSTTHNY